MATRINPNGNYDNPKYVRNIVRSLSTLSKEIASDYMPETSKVYKNNQDFIKKISGAKNKKISVNDIKNNTVYKSGKQLISNAIDDLKTGNWYNEERANKSMQEVASSMFGLDFSFMDDLLSGSGGVTNTVETDTKEIDGQTVTTTTNKSAIVTNTNMSAINMSFRNMARAITKNQNTAFGNLNTGFSKLLSFKTEHTVDFYNQTAQQFTQLNNVINTMYTNMEKLGNIELGGLKVTNDYNQLNSLIGSSDLLTLRYYTDHLKPDMIKNSKLSPVMKGVKAALMLAMPPVLKDTLAETNIMIKNLPVMLNQKFGDMRDSDSKFSRLIGDTFYKSINNGNSKYRIKNQAIGYDGVTRRAIVNVIPQLIAKIVNAMRKGGDGDELVYDYQSGGYRTKGDIMKASRMQFHEQMRGYSGRESDIEKYKNKVIAKLAETQEGQDPKKVTKKVRREVDKALYKMLENKELPTKNGKYSTNKNINTAIIETFLNMSAMDKVDFINATTRLTTPQEWLEGNESYHNVFDPLGYDDIKKKYDKDYYEELYLYFKSKGMDKLADRVREGDPYKRSANNLSKLNPFYYVVEGLRAGNDIVSRVMFTDGSEVDKKSFVGRLRDKIDKIISTPFNEHIENLKKKFKQKVNDNPYIEEIRNSGLVTGLKGLFRESKQYVKGGKTKEGRTKLVDKLKKDFLEPITEIFKQAITEPIKKQAANLGTFVKNVYTAFSEPIKNVYNKYKVRYEELKEPHEETVGEKFKKQALIEEKMRQNEESAASFIVDDVTANKEKYTELDKSVARGVLDMTKSIRTHLVEPLSSINTHISIVLSDGKRFKDEVDKMNLLSEYKVPVDMYEEDAQIPVDISKRLNLYHKMLGNANDLIVNMTHLFKEEGFNLVDEDMRDLDEDTMKRISNNKELSAVAIGMERVKNAADFIAKPFRNLFKEAKGSKESIVDSVESITTKSVSTITGVVGKFLNGVNKTSTTMANVLDNVLNVTQSFFKDTLPALMKSAGEELANTGKVVLEEVKNVGSDVWNELKATGSQIWKSTKDVFSNISTQLLDFTSRFTQRKFDVYIEGGTLTGIRNTVRIMKPKKSGYEYMKDKFLREDEDDSLDTLESDEDANESKGFIRERIAKRFEFIKDIVKGVAGSVVSAVTSGVKGLAGSVVRGIGSLVMSFLGTKGKKYLGKIGNKLGSIMKKTGAKLSERTTKGKKNLGKILGKAGSAVDVISGLTTDATPVYVVGGNLSGVGGAGDAVDTITDLVSDIAGDKLTSKALSKLGKTKAGAKLLSALGKGKNAVAATKWGSKALSVGGKLLGRSAATSALTSAASAGATTAASAAGSTALAAAEGATLAAGASAATAAGATTAATAAGTTAAAGAGTAAAGAAGTGIAATIGAVLLPLAAIWAGWRVLKGLKNWGKAGEIFGTDNPTLGQKMSAAAGGILDSLLPGDQSGWTKKIYSGATKIGGFFNKYVKPFTVFGMVDNIKNAITKKSQSETDSEIQYAKEQEQSVSDINDELGKNNTKSLSKSLMSSILSGNRGKTVTSMLAITSPGAFLAFNAVKKYRDFKKKEGDLEGKLLAKLSPAERDEYLSNKNASVYSSILRSQDGGKMVRLLMNTAITSSIANKGVTQDEVIDLLKESLSTLVSDNGYNRSNIQDHVSNVQSSVDLTVNGDYNANKQTYQVNGHSYEGTFQYDVNSEQANGGNGNNMSNYSKVGEFLSVDQLRDRPLWKQHPVNAQAINDFIASKTNSGKMYNQGPAFIRAARLYALDPGYLTAHAAQESGWGKSTITMKKNNFFGIGAFDSSPMASAYTFANPEDGIVAGAKFIAGSYVHSTKYSKDGKPLDTLNRMNPIYASDGNWARAIATIWSQFPVTGTIDDASANGATSELVTENADTAGSSIRNANSTTRLADSMANSVMNLDTVSEAINVINNSSYNLDDNDPLDDAITILENINKNMEESVNKDTIIERKQTSTKLDNSKNPFVDFVDTDSSLRSFGIDVMRILEGI